MNLCKCGCGDECQWSFIRGHQNRGKKHTMETKRKISEIKKVQCKGKGNLVICCAWCKFD